MEGVEVVTSDDGFAMVAVRLLSDELKDEIRLRLAAFCYGSARVTEDLAYYSFQNTVLEFLARFDTKSDTTKIGMIGELLCHIFTGSTHSDLVSSAVFFNKEERSIKKGFDLTFHEEEQNRVWYGEVKSGEVQNGTADEKARTLLNHAATDLYDKFTNDARRSMWDSAIMDADLTLERNAAASVKDLLRDDATELQKAGDSTLRDVLLSAAVFHGLDHCEISPAFGQESTKAHRDSGRFRRVRTLIVQQSTVQEIVDYLREELATGSSDVV